MCFWNGLWDWSYRYSSQDPYVGGRCETQVSTELMIKTDYINQAARFQVLEGFGCVDATDNSILQMIIIQSWTVIPPLLSVVVYCRELSLYHCASESSLMSFIKPES